MTATTLRACVVAASLALLASSAIAQDVVLRGTLGGGNVMSATESPASGEVAAVLDSDGTLQLDMVFAGLELGATGAALHTGRYNENGPMVAQLDVDEGATAGRIVGQQIALTPLIAAAVRAGDSYVVISTIQYPDGAIRAQLMPQPVRLDSNIMDQQGTATPAIPPVPEPAPVQEPEEDD